MNPMRRVVRYAMVGSTHVRLTLDCGHEVLRSHVSRWSKRSRCEQCPPETEAQKR